MSQDADTDDGVLGRSVTGDRHDSDPERRGGDRRPRVGLVLGAGGVVGGAFHAGVLAALHEVTGWDPRRVEVVVGTSAGSISGTALRAGLSTSDMLARAEGRPVSAAARHLAAPPATPLVRTSSGRAPSTTDIRATLRRAAARPFAARPLALLAGLLPEGTVGTDVITDAIEQLHPGPWPDDALWICAVRQRDGRLVVFGRDAMAPVADAVAASCAIPGFFRPVTIDGEGYVDGGAHSPTNAAILADQALDLVVVVSPMSIAGSRRLVRRTSPVRLWSRALLDAEAARLRRRGAHVIAFQPTEADIAVMGPNALDPRRRAAVARQAFESTLRRAERADTDERLRVLADDR